MLQGSIFRLCCTVTYGQDKVLTWESPSQNDHEGARETANFKTRFSHPEEFPETEEQRQARENLIGATIDIDETRRRNDGMVHLRYADNTEKKAATETEAPAGSEAAGGKRKTAEQSKL